ncbi:MAG: hypothetical protein U1F71_07310 [Verrucomicrobiaceae bacterium]
MTFVEFKTRIERGLSRKPAGLTWKELKVQLRLPYERPCPTWVKQLEDEIGLKRVRESGPAHVWKLTRDQRR